MKPRTREVPKGRPSVARKFATASRATCALAALVALQLLSGCASRPVFTKDEGAAIVKKMSDSGAAQVLYLYPQPKLFGAKFESFNAKPFYCYLDGKDIGNANFGEFLVVPINPGQHHIFCAKEYAAPNAPILATLVAQGIAAASAKGGVAINVGKGDVYVSVKDGMTIFSEPNIQLVPQLPQNFFDEHLLSKACTTCPQG